MTSDIDYSSSIQAEGTQRSTGWLVAYSIALLGLGTVAVIWPAVASLTFALYIAWFLLIGGVVRIVKAFRSRPVRSFWLNLVVGGLYAIAGLYAIFNPIAGTASFTLALGALFATEGVFTLLAVWRNRIGGKRAWMLVLDGVVTLVLGLLVLTEWPSSALWLLGVYVGISLLSSGGALLGVVLGDGDPEPEAA